MLVHQEQRSQWDLTHLGVPGAPQESGHLTPSLWSLPTLKGRGGPVTRHLSPILQIPQLSSCLAETLQMVWLPLCSGALSHFLCSLAPS